MAFLKAEQNEDSDGTNVRVSNRFKPVGYTEEYTPSWSNSFRHRTEVLWYIILADKKGKNEPRWAQCCYTVERKRVRGQLGHPAEALIPIGRLFAQEQIKNLDDFTDYLVRHLPTNAYRDTRMPQVNMKHGFKDAGRDTTESPDRRTCRCNPEALGSKILGLEAIVADFLLQIVDARKENSALRTELLVSQAH